MEGKSSVLDEKKAIGFKSQVKDFVIDPNLTIVYALSVGFNQDPMEKKHFKFTYELSDEFSVFPSYSSVIPVNDIANLVGNCPGIPDFNLMSLLHGEEWVQFVNPLPTNGTVQYQGEIIDLEDKGKGTVLSIQFRIFNKDTNVTYSLVTMKLFIRGLKGQGIKSRLGKQAVLPSVPKGEPMKEMTIKTSPNQALYYRIGGNDANPLHADPDMAEMGGFDRPILHGLCTYGVALRAAYELFADGVTGNLLSFNARFTSHAFPGDALKVRFWKGNGGNLIVSVHNTNRGVQVLVGEMTIKNPKF